MSLENLVGSLAGDGSPLAGACAAAFGASLAAAVALPRLALRTGWVDAAGGSARKLQRRPVPAVGGAIVLAGLLAGWALLGRTALVPGAGLEELLSRACGARAELWPLGGLLAAFAVGLADDLRPGGLGAGLKLAGQAAAGLVLGAPLWVEALGGAPSGGVDPLTASWAAALLAAGAVLATNAVNTFDNADGAAGALVAAAALAPAPILSAALVPFLALNLARRRGGEVAAYLGDSGSHLLGFLILLTPAAWPALILPLADLLRLALVRLAAGARPWRGDRRHLAHRLLRRGVPRLAVPLLLAGLALPTVLLGLRGAPWTLLGFALALALGDAPAARSAACSEPGPGG